MGMIYLTVYLNQNQKGYTRLCMGGTDIYHLISFVVRNWQKTSTNTFSMVSPCIGKQTSLLTHSKGKWQQGKLILLFTEAGRTGDAAVLDGFLSPVGQASEDSLMSKHSRASIQDGFSWVMSQWLTGCFCLQKNVQTFRKLHKSFIWAKILRMCLETRSQWIEKVLWRMTVLRFMYLYQRRKCKEGTWSSLVDIKEIGESKVENL